MQKSKYCLSCFRLYLSAEKRVRTTLALVFYTLLLTILLFTLPAQSDYLDIPIEIREFEATLVNHEPHPRNRSAALAENTAIQSEDPANSAAQSESAANTVQAETKAHADSHSTSPAQATAEHLSLPHYQISCRVNYSLNEHMRQALGNGIQLFSEFRVKLIKHSSWWFNDTHVLANKRYSLQYHELSKKYIVTELDANGQHLKQWNFAALPSALKQMGDIERLDLPPLELDLSAGEYALFAEAEITEETPELPLRIQSWFSSRKQNLKSEGIMWPLP